MLGSRLIDGYCMMCSSGTAGGTLALFRCSRRNLGGLEDLRELERATFDILGSTIPLLLAGLGWWALRRFSFLWSPRTIVLRSSISVGVISEGSTRGKGLFVDLSIWLLPTMEAHWSGRPTYFPSRLSKPVWTLCSKLVGGEICGFFFFLVNISSGDCRLSLAPDTGGFTGSVK